MKYYSTTHKKTNWHTKILLIVLTRAKLAKILQHFRLSVNSIFQQNYMQAYTENCGDIFEGSTKMLGTQIFF